MSSGRYDWLRPSFWLSLVNPDDLSMQLCPETIYRALLVPGGPGLHKRYCRRLRTGRRIRKVPLAHPKRARHHSAERR